MAVKRSDPRNALQLMQTRHVNIGQWEIEQIELANRRLPVCMQEARRFAPSRNSRAKIAANRAFHSNGASTTLLSNSPHHTASKLSLLSCATSSPSGTCSIGKVNPRVTDRVICVVHVPVTFSRRK